VETRAAAAAEEAVRATNEAAWAAEDKSSYGRIADILIEVIEACGPDKAS
jgi:hypothetical protein